MGDGFKGNMGGFDGYNSGGNALADLGFGGFGGFGKMKKNKKTMVPIVVQVEHGLFKGKRKKGKFQKQKGFGKLIESQNNFAGPLQPYGSGPAPVPVPIPSNIISSTIPFPTPMKAFSSFAGGFPSFGVKGLTGSSFSNFGGLGGLGGLNGLNGLNSLNGLSGSFGGFGGIKNKLSMLLGNKFGMGGGLLGLMGGWD